MHNYKIHILIIFFLGIICGSDCTDSDACNYNVEATIDDGSCYYPVSSCDTNLYDCCPPDGFGFRPQQEHLLINIDSAYKFDSQMPLEILEDWIGGFKKHDETQDGACSSISDDCPDVNFDGILTEDAELCVGSRPWNGGLSLFGDDPLIADQPNDSDGYLIDEDQPYIKLFDSDTDNIYLMSAYKNGEQYQIICGGVNGQYDEGEVFFDCGYNNENELICEDEEEWDPSYGNGIWDEGEEFIDEAEITCNDSFEWFELDLLIADCLVDDGDLNSDGEVNIFDIIVLINLVLQGGFNESGDINEDGILNIVDCILLVNLIVGN